MVFMRRLDHPGDGKAMGTYIESYVYDAVGNILSMQHRGSDSTNPGWTRAYAYNETSQLEAGKVNNRLSNTKIGGVTEIYNYDGLAGLHSNITAMPHLPLMQWDYHDHLQATAQQVVNNGTPETTWYVYDASGQRVRKVTERQAAAGVTPTRMKERIYLGSFEVYREYENDGETVKLEHETLHIMDDKQRIALVETRTVGNDPAPAQLIRYQLGNHLGSASLELDDKAQIISYEEYFPYGSTSYQAVRRQIETPKRYRYTGKERDEENGLYYHGARYYTAWLGRWVSCDPIGIGDGVNLFAYGKCNPIRFTDQSGTQATDPEKATVHKEYIQFLPKKEAAEKWSKLDLKKQGIQLQEVVILAEKPASDETTKITQLYLPVSNKLAVAATTGIATKPVEIPLTPEQQASREALEERRYFDKIIAARKPDILEDADRAMRLNSPNSLVAGLEKTKVNLENYEKSGGNSMLVKISLWFTFAADAANQFEGLQSKASIKGLRLELSPTGAAKPITTEGKAPPNKYTTNRLGRVTLVKPLAGYPKGLAQPGWKRWINK